MSRFVARVVAVLLQSHLNGVTAGVVRAVLFDRPDLLTRVDTDPDEVVTEVITHLLTRVIAWVESEDEAREARELARAVVEELRGNAPWYSELRRFVAEELERLRKILQVRQQ